MAELAEVKRLLREVVGANPNLPIPAKVLSVSGDLCTVQLKGGFKLTDVKLKATSNGNSSFVLVTPKLNSMVLLLSLTGKLDNLTIIKVDEVEKMELVQGDLKIVVDSSDNKIGIENSTTSMNALFADLVSILKTLKVFTPVGPSGTPLPDSITKITAFETKFKALLK
ncbi:hypothetical protein [Pseudotamlana carrageenivorans]|uniref:Uncharacterized protein n=1 Tax=Pseudotamlana carrageenivorans TaxID=2069432 RepID=A0A2I7SF02_9FLAO|nr:hypothetical protein [Tamlana carrageenivorans]AUS04481.1 hypothetical protein C1A40_02890 [Tamlana carrageenivorans]